MAAAPETFSPEAASQVHEHVGQVEGHHSGGGLPQLQMEYWGGQIVWLLLIFAVTYLLLARVFVPRMRKALDERSQAISGAVAEARALRDQAEAQAESARSELAEARARAQRTSADAQARAKAEAAAREAEADARLDARLAEAEGRIRAARDHAMTKVREIAADTAGALVVKLTGEAPTSAELDEALAAEPA